jgi:hypothetical protein
LPPATQAGQIFGSRPAIGRLQLGCWGALCDIKSKPSIDKKGPYHRTCHRVRHFILSAILNTTAPLMMTIREIFWQSYLVGTMHDLGPSDRELYSIQ